VNSLTSNPVVEEITIGASAERVFEALVNPAERVKWWGDEGSFRTTHMESDLRPWGEMGDARSAPGRRALYDHRRVSRDRPPAPARLHLVA
jgi:uncharacterized protein YndB with AHSA1/START domain